MQESNRRKVEEKSNTYSTAYYTDK